MVRIIFRDMARRKRKAQPAALSSGQIRVPVSEFKAHCLRLLDEVEDGKQLVLTRHGQEIAVVSPMKRRVGSDFGSMKGLIHVVGDIVHGDWSDDFDALRDDGS